MVLQIYSAPTCERRLREGPAGAYVDELATVLLERGYPTRYLRRRFAVITELNRWLLRRKIGVRELDSHRIKRFMQHRSRQTCMESRGERVTLDILVGLLRSHGEIPPRGSQRRTTTGVDQIVDQYRYHLVEQQGLSFRTVSRYLPLVRRFLSATFGTRALDLGALRAQTVVQFVQRYAGRHSAVSNAMMVCALRSFLRFLVLRGTIGEELRSCVPAVPNRRHTGIPRHLSAEELEQLLECCKGASRPVQMRDYAILLLLARLGLRASEIISLTLEDIDWEQGEFVVHGKGSRKTRFPLPVDVGSALASYLRNGRPPCSTRTLFVCSKAPIKAFQNHSTVSTIVRRCLQRAGLNPPLKGAHLLRHTLATECLRRGATLAEIGEILRHRQIDTTAIYAKVDLLRLRSIAAPWPEASITGGQL